MKVNILCWITSFSLHHYEALAYFDMYLSFSYSHWKAFD